MWQFSYEATAVIVMSSSRVSKRFQQHTGGDHSWSQTSVIVWSTTMQNKVNDFLGIFRFSGTWLAPKLSEFERECNATNVIRIDWFLPPEILDLSVFRNESNLVECHHRLLWLLYRHEGGRIPVHSGTLPWLLLNKLEDASMGWLLCKKGHCMSEIQFILFISLWFTCIIPFWYLLVNESRTVAEFGSVRQHKSSARQFLLVDWQSFFSTRFWNEFLPYISTRQAYLSPLTLPPSERNNCY